MSDVASTTAPVAPALTETAVTPPSFTSRPIEPVGITADPAKSIPTGNTEQETDNKKSDNVIAALAKASNEARLTKKQIAERDERIKALETELETAKTGGAKATELQAEIDAILKNPGILLKKGKSFQEILDALAEPDAVADPKLTELEQRLAAREKADQEAKERAEKEAAERTETERNAANDSARKNIAAFVADVGAKPGQDGTPRWALVSMDDTAVERARLEVLDYVTKNKVEATNEIIYDLLSQAFDQMEQVAREDVTKRYERLRPAQQNVTNSTERRNNESFVTGRPSQDMTDTVQPRRDPGISAAIRGNPLPPPSAPRAPTFTGGLR